MLLRCFNTSHVTLYLCSDRRNLPHFLVSIHLMLLFILLRFPLRSLWRLVSIHLMLLFISFLYGTDGSVTSFNTSHVTLYRTASCGVCRKSFCFNTSHVTLYRLLHPYLQTLLKFQYISCYSLSTVYPSSCSELTRFNTSHVTLYLAMRSPLTWRSEGFNTSHVTLYRSTKDEKSYNKLVSIHLMLLFI